MKTEEVEAHGGTRAAAGTDEVLGASKPYGRHAGEWQRGPSPAVREKLRAIAVALVALVGAAFILYPLGTTLGLPLSDMPDVLSRGARRDGLGQVFINTVLLAVGTLFIAAVAGIGLALCAMRLPGRWFSVGSGLAIAPLFFPALAAIVGWVVIFTPAQGYGNQILRATPFFSGDVGPVDVFTLLWIIAFTGIYLISFVFLFISTALRELDPAQESAARMAGAGWWRAQLDVVLPAVRPALMYALVICLLLALGQFTAPLLLGRNAGVDVITTEMFKLSSDFQVDRPLAALLAVPLILAALALVAVQRRRVGALSRYAATGKGTASRGQGRKTFLIPLAGFFGFTVIPPTLALLIVSTSQFWQGQVPWDSLTLVHYRYLFDNARFTQSLTNTLQLSVVGTILATLGAFVVSRFLLVSGRHRLKSFVDYIVNLPIAVPAVVFGLGIFLSFAIGPLGMYGSRWLFVIAWVILVIPHGVRIQLAGQARIGNELVSAARIAGSPSVHAVIRIVIPLLRRAAAASALLMFILMTQEFAAAALLRTTEHGVLSTFLYEQWSSGNYPRTAATALVMVVVTMVGAAAILMLGGKDPFERSARRRRQRRRGHAG